MTQAGGQPLAHRHEQAVADRVADALVDDLEPVEVQHDDGDRVGFILRRPGQCMGDAVRQQFAVRQPGREVVQGATLGVVHEPGVVEDDGRQLREP